MMAYQRQRILVIESNSAVQKLVSRTLSDQTFDLQAASNAYEGLAMFVEREPDLVLLGLTLPDMDGFELCRRIRHYATTPILVMLGPDTAIDGASVLNKGADDYVTMPFSGQELQARIQALLRRSSWREQNHVPGAMRIGELQINFQSQQLLRDGQVIDLSQTEWRLLDVLVRHMGKVISHDILHRSVWGDTNYKESSNLRRYIHRLRSKLESDPENPRYLVSEQGIGYRFLAPREAAPATPAPVENKRAVKRLLNLPVPPTSFIGWTGEVDRVKSLLLTKDVRLVSLIGPGGSGKSRLALQVASHLVESFEHGVCFVGLASVLDPSLVAEAIAQALGLQEEKGQNIQDTLHAYLADRRMLLILDNFEHLVAAAPLVSNLLESNPGLKILITSRSVLHLYGEYEFEVPPLALPDLRRISVAEVSQSPAVALFIERARAVQPGFNLTPQNVYAVAELCVQLDGLPLAIELAAARMKLLSPQSIAARLSNRFALLADGAQNLPKRQQTMRNTLDWSYDLLTLEEKVLFARLGVFKGGCTMDAVEAIAGFAYESPEMGLVHIEPLDHMSSLLDKSMLVREMVQDEIRFSMLETILGYARERLEASGEASLLRERHVNYFLVLAESAHAQLQNDHAQEWVDRLEQEHDNLRAALQWSLTQESQRETALRLATKLSIFWSGRKYLAEGRRWLDAALEHGNHNSLHEVRAGAYREAAWLALSQGYSDDAERFVAKGQEIWEPLRHDPHVTHIKAFILEEQGKYDEATLILQASLESYRLQDDKKNMDFALHILGQIALKQADYDRAETYMSEALSIKRESAKSDQGRSLLTLAHINRLRRDYERAIEQYYEALAIFKEAGMGWGVGHALLNLGKIAVEQKEYLNARRFFVDALNLFDELSDFNGLAYCFESLAALAGVQRQVELAARLWGASQALRKSLNSPLPPADFRQFEEAVKDVRYYLAENGQSDTAFMATWRAGQAMTLEDAVAFTREAFV